MIERGVSLMTGWTSESVDVSAATGERFARRGRGSGFMLAREVVKGAGDCGGVGVNAGASDLASALSAMIGVEDLWTCTAVDIAIMIFFASSSFRFLSDLARFLGGACGGSLAVEEEGAAGGDEIVVASTTCIGTPSTSCSFLAFFTSSARSLAPRVLAVGGLPAAS